MRNISVHKPSGQIAPIQYKLHICFVLLFKFAYFLSISDTITFDQRTPKFDVPFHNENHQENHHLVALARGENSVAPTSIANYKNLFHFIDRLLKMITNFNFLNANIVEI